MEDEEEEACGRIRRRRRRRRKTTRRGLEKISKYSLSTVAVIPGTRVVLLQDRARRPAL